MRVNLRTHPKTIRLAAKLGVSKNEAVGCLHAAWVLADQHADEEGRLDIPADEVDALIEQAGFCAALAAVGWLLIGDDWVQFVDYREHNGATAKDRAENTSRQRTSRKKRDSVSRDSRDKSATREEKRREENTPPPPTPSPPSDHGSCADDPEWVEAVEAFAKIGLGSASSTAQESKQRGFRPRVVLAYVDYYRAHAWAWSAGAVRHVLREAPPNCPPQEAIWPKPREPDARAKEALAVLADCREYVAERGLKLAPEQFVKAFSARLEKRGLSDLADESLCRERWAREGVRQ